MRLQCLNDVSQYAPLKIFKSLHSRSRTNNSDLRHELHNRFVCLFPLVALSVLSSAYPLDNNG